jgi:hypothetical protein
MSLNLTDVRRIAREVARDENPALEVVAARADGDSGYTEVIITLHGCSQEPCNIMLGLSRGTSERQFRAAVSERLREHLQQHQMSSAIGD